MAKAYGAHVDNLVAILDGFEQHNNPSLGYDITLSGQSAGQCGAGTQLAGVSGLAGVGRGVCGAGGAGV